MLDRFFNAVIRNKIAVIRVFYLFWLVTVISLFASALSVFADNISSYAFWYKWALLSGKLSLAVFVLVLVPGIFKRFGKAGSVLVMLRVFRRYLGITMFLLAAFHGLTVSLLPKIKAGWPFSTTLFEVFGSFSLFLLFFLFITSNDISEKLLKLWWFRLHRLVYIIMWLILFHLALQRLSFWSVLAGILVIGEMSAIIYSHKKIPRKQ